MINSYREWVEEFGLIYQEEIKPLIKSGDYETAKRELFNIKFDIENNKRIFNTIQIPTVHFGLRLLTSICLLYDELSKQNFNPNSFSVRNLEASLAQTKLPTQEDVRRSSVR
jgi:hypothetical protein